MVAALRVEYTQALAGRDVLAKDRVAVIDELRCLNDGDVWDVAGVTRRQQYSEKLAEELIKADVKIAETLMQLNSSLQKLVSADQSVQALQRLAEIQHADFRKSQLKCEEREFEDVLMAKNGVTHPKLADDECRI